MIASFRQASLTAVGDEANSVYQLGFWRNKARVAKQPALAHEECACVDEHTCRSALSPIDLAGQISGWVFDRFQNGLDRIHYDWGLIEPDNVSRFLCDQMTTPAGQLDMIALHLAPDLR